MKDILAQGFAQMGITPPKGAIDKLCQYSDLLLEQNKVMNLTASPSLRRWPGSTFWIPPLF